MIDKINKLNNTALFCMSAIAIALILGLTTIIIKSDNISYENGQTKIKVLQAQQIANEEEFSNKRLAEELQQFKQALERHNAPKEVTEAFEQFEPTAQTAIKNSSELREVVEDFPETTN